MLTEKQIETMIKTGREFMKMPHEDADYKSDQDLKKQQPPLVKEPMGGTIIALPTNFEELNLENDILKVINTRQSHRVFTQKNMTLLELSFLLWSTQGVKSIRGKSYATIRTVPCGGARHEFETYFIVQYVEGLEKGLYHYLPMTHQIEFLSPIENCSEFISKSTAGQDWCCKASIVLYYSAVFYRAEWRYGVYSHRVQLMDIGHVMQNVYLACTAAHLGTTAIGYIDGDYLNSHFTLDGEEESMICCCPVGTVDAKNQQAEIDFYAFVKEQGL
ncbi:MAG: SagB/ThcOx family dehydrogenase [Erysipelotrichaceae bacterium]|nr:SagB/ThcOx family dehydrogenase [Erysipelotrichaceae bacterium]